MAGILLFALPAQAGEFKAYRRSDPAAFAQGVRAYDGADYAEAYRIWLPLAERQDPAAMRNVGQLLRRGLGVTQDLKRALVFYKRAAEFGLTGAQANLALMYYDGEGTARNPKEAARWFLAAARQGHVISQYELAKMLEAGDGVPLNPRAARIFYAIAAKAGFQPAYERLAALDEKLGLPPPLPEPQAVASLPPAGQKAPQTPRQRPADAAALAAAFNLRGTLTDAVAELQMAPDEIFTLRAGFSDDSGTASLLGLTANSPDEAGIGEQLVADARCAAPANPFDRRASMCRMPPVRD